jgi:peptide deformylase
MKSLEVLTHPAPILRVQAKEITQVTSEISHLVKNMIQTMYIDNGVGLAATQVGSEDRIFVMDVTEDQSEPLVFINPEITKESGSCVMREGCLSFPGVWVDITRSEKVTVKAIDIHGKDFVLEADGLKARCILHELDHLNGVVLVDHVSRLKRERALKKLMLEMKARARA